MLRVGRLPTIIPAGVTAVVPADNVVSVKGPRGELVKAMNKDTNIVVENNQVVVTRPSDQKKHRALHGLTRAPVNNMITRVERGFEKSLELTGVGYRAQLQGKRLVMNLGCSYPAEIEPIGGATLETPAATRAVVKGIDKEKAGVATADIRSWGRLEPYKGKEIKYDNKVIRRKEGRTGKK